MNGPQCGTGEAPAPVRIELLLIYLGNSSFAGKYQVVLTRFSAFFCGFYCLTRALIHFLQFSSIHAILRATFKFHVKVFQPLR